VTLRLRVEDAEDLQVISAALQDAVAKLGDLTFDPRTRTLTLAVNRYRWEAGQRRERVRSALQVGSVLNVRSRALRRDAPGAVVELLSIGFEAAEPPGGILVVTLAGDGELRAEVEALDAVLVDLSDPWPTRREPRHD
jgi:hypothetical protein